MITQSIPDNEVAWHAGDGYGNGNMTTIAIEICVNPDSNLEKATDNAAWLAAKLLRAQGLDHQSLYQHHDWSGKNCPSQIRANKPYNWAKFVSKVKGYLNQNNASSKPKPDQILNKGDKFIFPDIYQVSKVSASRDAVICYALTGTPVLSTTGWMQLYVMRSRKAVRSPVTRYCSLVSTLKSKAHTLS